MNGFLAKLIEQMSENFSIFLIFQARLSATLATIFFLRREWVPARLVITLYIILGIFLLNSSIPIPALDLSDFSKIFIAVAIQCILGITTALVINFFAEFFLGFGQLVSMQSGLGFVNFFVPKVGNITPLTQFFIMVATIIFLNLNGHLLLIQMMIDSMRALPVLPLKFNSQVLWDTVLYSGILFKGVLMLSISIVLTLLLTNITLAVLSKFAPQMNLLTVGINISLLICFFVIYLSFDVLLENGNVLFNEIWSFVGSKII